MSDSAPPPRALVLSDKDNVATILGGSERGASIWIGSAGVPCLDPVPPGHKLAIVPIARGDKIVKFGAPIGTAMRDIARGEHVHVHNVASDYTSTHQGHA